jgi:hypothetical protein
MVGDYGFGDPVWACWPMAGPWLAQHLYEHFLFGGDLSFLRVHAYPVMKGAAEFCLNWLVDDGKGHLVTAPSTSPEHKFITADGKQAAIGVASTMDMALIRDLFGNVIDAADLLGADAPFRSYTWPRIPSREFGARMPVAQRSPLARTRRSTVSIVNSEGSRSSVSSLQASGVDTLGCGSARTEYTPATVFPRMF